MCVEVLVLFCSGFNTRRLFGIFTNFKRDCESRKNIKNVETNQKQNFKFLNLLTERKESSLFIVLKYRQSILNRITICIRYLIEW